MRRPRSSSFGWRCPATRVRAAAEGCPEGTVKNAENGVKESGNCRSGNCRLIAELSNTSTITRSKDSIVRRRRSSGCGLFRARAAAQCQQMIADGANLSLRVATHLRVGRLRELRPERRHARAWQEARWRFQPFQDPVRLQPLGCHPEVGCQLRRIDVLRNRPEHVAALALHQL